MKKPVKKGVLSPIRCLEEIPSAEYAHRQKAKFARLEDTCKMKVKRVKAAL